MHPEGNFKSVTFWPRFDNFVRLMNYIALNHHFLFLPKLIRFMSGAYLVSLEGTKVGS